MPRKTQSVLVDDMEHWKPIEKLSGFYEVSNYGRVRGRYINKVRILKPSDNGNGYLLVSIKQNGVRKNYYIHRLVAEAFLQNPNDYPVVNHKDSDKYNNHVENLEWCTQKYNVNYSKDKMRGLRNVSYSSTGERYITKKGDKFRLCNRTLGIDKCFNTIEEAINVREELLNVKIGIS